jgi:NADPH-dependent 2,4-dienoyl-CoA reductase/sulfur reductase-like enzyme
MKHYDVIIVGAGPAGIAAAKAASKSSRSVIVIDDNHTPGGQIWRGSNMQVAAEFLPAARVIDGNPSDKQITVETDNIFQLSYSKLILCTGARELFLPFPGWTLPNILGVGGIQALAKSGLDVKGKRIVVAGSGPLLLAVAAYLQQHGATVPIIAEQASWTSLAKFGLTLLQQPSKIKQAFELNGSLRGTRYLPNTWVTQASGKNKIAAVTLHHNGRELNEFCDYLAVAYGFVPNTELPQLMGCYTSKFVEVDNNQLTSQPDIYCAGEPTGLGGVDESLLEGEIAGLAATGQTHNLNRRKTAHFSASLKQTFALRPELKQLPPPDTIICRCEDVPLSRIQHNINSWSEAKLHFRCGMGPCQGRVCGPILNHYFGFAQDSIRPPIFPTKLENLIKL